MNFRCRALSDIQTALLLLIASFFVASNLTAEDPRSNKSQQQVERPVVAEAIDWQRVNLEDNLRWMLARQRVASAGNRADRDAAVPRVGVFADSGVWHLGARSLVESLERVNVPCQVLDRTMIAPDKLKNLETILLPGGWAPYQLAALDAAAQSALKRFVEHGGRCVGVCAGAYLVSRSVKWEDQTYPYPLALFDGTAVGPVSGLAAWPNRGPVKLAPTTEGRELGLAAIEEQSFYYSGGSSFVGGNGVATLARYPNGTSAVIRISYGKGDVILSGVHFERPAPADGGDDAPPPEIAGTILKALVTGKPAS